MSTSPLRTAATHLISLDLPDTAAQLIVSTYGSTSGTVIPTTMSSIVSLGSDPDRPDHPVFAACSTLDGRLPKKIPFRSARIITVGSLKDRVSQMSWPGDDRNLSHRSISKAD